MARERVPDSEEVRPAARPHEFVALSWTLAQMRQGRKKVDLEWIIVVG